MVRRLAFVVAVVVAVALAGIALTRAPEPTVTTTAGGSSPTTRSVPSTTTTTEAGPPPLAADQSGCRGLGAARVPGDDLTWVQQGELRTRDGCLLRFGDDLYGPSWNAAGTQLLGEVAGMSGTGRYVFSAAGARRIVLDRGQWRGSTDDLIGVDEGVVRVLSPDGSLSVVPVDGMVSEAAFAVAGDGTWIVGEAVVAGVRGLHRVEVPSGRAELLAVVEEHGIRSVAVTPDDDIVFVEQAGAVDEVKRLDARSGRVTVLAGGAKELVVSATPSRFDPSAIAWHVGGSCGDPPVLGATIGGRALKITGLPEYTHPDSWLRDGTLLLLDRGSSCDYSPGTLWTYSNGKTTRLAENVLDVAVR